jgi:hypothetical protein
MYIQSLSSEKSLDSDILPQYNSAMKGIMHKRIALLFLALLLFLTIFPVFYPVEDEGLLKDIPAYKAHSHLATALNIAYDFDSQVGWTRNSSTLNTLRYLPSFFCSSTENRAPPA